MNSLTLIRTWASSAHSRSSSAPPSGGDASSPPGGRGSAGPRPQLGLRWRRGRTPAQVHPRGPGRSRRESRRRPARRGPRRACWATNGSFIRISAWAGHVRHVAAAGGVQRRGHVEGDQHRRQEVPPDLEVEAAAAVAVERAAGLRAAVVVGVVVHERRQMDLDAGAAHRAGRAGPRRPGSRRGSPRPPAGGRSSGAAAGCPGRRPPPRRRRCSPCAKVLLRTSSRTSLLTDQPSRTNRSARSSSSSGWVGRSPSAPKLSTEATMPAAEDVVPDAVDRDPRRQRVGRVGDLPGELQPAAAALGRRWLPVAPPAIAGSIRRGTTGPGGLRVAADEDVLVLAASRRSWPGRGSGLRQRRPRAAPDSFRQRRQLRRGAGASDPARPRPTSHASRRGPGLGVGPVGQRRRRPAPRAIRARPARTARPGRPSDVDRRRLERPQAPAVAAAQGGRPLVGEDGAADGDVSLGTAAGRRPHVVQVLRRRVRELDVRRPAPPHLQVERAPTRRVVVRASAAGRP